MTKVFKQHLTLEVFTKSVNIAKIVKNCLSWSGVYVYSLRKHPTIDNYLFIYLFEKQLLLYYIHVKKQQKTNT